MSKKMCQNQVIIIALETEGDHNNLSQIYFRENWSFCLSC